ncbi:MAG: acyl carrier protein [Lachnospiraceae bacterium]|nr:acyl carrier protein [Lachnospiraceae bacterium]
MDKLREILEENWPDIDFDEEDQLLDSGLMDSVSVVTLIGLLEDEFDISISMEYIQPKYFQSMDTIWEMIEELQ